MKPFPWLAVFNREQVVLCYSMEQCLPTMSQFFLKFFIKLKFPVVELLFFYLNNLTKISIVSNVIGGSSLNGKAFKRN